MWSYPVLDPVSQAYPRAEGRSPTCYSPVRRSCTPKGLTARLACVKHAASVRPEPGSNSPTKTGPTKNVDRRIRDGVPRRPNSSGTKTTKQENKLDTLLSSQKTPAHHHPPRGELPGLSTTVHPPRSIGSQGVPVRGAASGPVDRASRARSVRRLADNEKVTPRYPTPSNRPHNHGSSTITAGQRPTPAPEPRLTAGFAVYDSGHSAPRGAALPRLPNGSHRH